jgi:hypothetical protein
LPTIIFNLKSPQSNLKFEKWVVLRHTILSVLQLPLLAYEITLLTIRAGWRSRQCWRLVQQQIAPYSQEARLTRLERLRFRTYSIALAVCEHLFCRLTGQVISTTQRRHTAVLSGLVPLFDDLIDESNYSSAEIHEISQLRPVRGIWRERLSMQLYQQLDTRWSPVWEQVLEYQINSEAQLGAARLPPEQIIDLTRGKGGYSVLLGMQVIGETDDPALARAAFEFGYVAQLINDLFDVWKDRQSGQQTLLTTTTDLRFFAEHYRQTVVHSQQLIEVLPYPRWRIRRVQILYKTVLALGELALQRLEKLQASNHNYFDIQAFTRTELVCDMARWPNRFRWAWKVVFGIFVK